ncbi:hypothetical protein [Georgenia sp. Marseille-Q6866]
MACQPVAGALHPAAGAAENHLCALADRLGVRDRTRAVLCALDRGLLETA